MINYDFKLEPPDEPERAPECDCGHDAEAHLDCDGEVYYTSCCGKCECVAYAVTP